MENGKKIALGCTLVVVLAVGGRLGMIAYQRHQAATETTEKPTFEWKLTDDDMVHLKHLYPSSMKDARDLVGKRVWVSAGGQMQYFPAAGKSVQWKPAGTLLGAEPMDIKDVITARPPASLKTLRIPEGSSAIMAIFTRPEEKAQYAATVGYIENGQYTFYLDEMFFYDDPRTLYKHWGTDNWTAIDKHEPKMGMSENMMMMALGQVSKSGSTKKGDRTVHYFNLGKPYDVTFVNDKAVKIEAVKE
ncbi:hypothetical protein [Terriglobus tenax]|uniref:hypothetical protein n=1 Tax=Terriglobus tenax TaxID=1111115 RepID=UPI0021DFF53C|nr:hypothetical protein [Terriglobus tenax]